MRSVEFMLVECSMVTHLPWVLGRQCASLHKHVHLERSEIFEGNLLVVPTCWCVLHHGAFPDCTDSIACGWNLTEKCTPTPHGHSVPIARLNSQITVRHQVLSNKCYAWQTTPMITAPHANANVVNYSSKWMGAK